MQIVVKIALFAIGCYGLWAFRIACGLLAHYADFFGFTVDDLGVFFSTHPGAQIVREAMVPFFSRLVVLLASSSICLGLAMQGKFLDSLPRIRWRFR